MVQKASFTVYGEEYKVDDEEEREKDEIVLGFMLVAMPASFHHFDLDFFKRKHEKLRQLEGEYTNLA